LEEFEKIDTKINFSSAAFKKYFNNTSWLFFEKIIRVVLGAFVIISITNYLGPKNFGIYSYVLSFTGLFTAIATLGLDSILLRELVKKPDLRNDLLGSSFILKLVGAIFSILLLAIAIIFTSHTSLTNLLIFIIAATPIFQTLNIIDFFFQSKVQSKNSVIVQSTSFIITSIIKLLLIYFEASLISFVIFTTFEYLFLAIGYIVMYKSKSLKIFSWRFNKNIAKTLLIDSWPLMLSGIVITIYMKIDQVMIKQMLNDSEVGFYASAVRLCEAWYFLPMIITTSLFPAIIYAKKVSENLYKNRMQKLYDLLAWSSIGIAVITTFLAKDVILILYSPEFTPAVSVLIIYIWAGVAVFLGVANSQYLIAENFTKISFYKTFLGMIINVILNLILIPFYGITGAAVATLVSYSAATFSIFFTKATREQSLMMFKAILFVDIFTRLRK